MTRITRRHLLQFTGSAIAAIGINQLLFQQQAQLATVEKAVTEGMLLRLMG